MAEAHIRIDEGIKRGPKKPSGTRRSVPRRRDEATGQVQGIPPNLDPQEVLQRYLSEQTTSQIAASYGVSRKTMVAWLREVVPDEWRRVQIIRAHDMKEQGNEGLGVAEDALSLARAREQVKSAQWELQALDKDYQPKQQLTVTTEIKVETILDSEACALLGKIKARSVAQSPNAALLQPIIDVEPTSNES